MSPQPANTVSDAAAARLTEQPLDLDALLAATQAPEDGAVVTFGGTVRLFNDGLRVTAINYSAYAPLAEKMLREIEQQTLARFAVTSCRIRHRLGDLQIGDLSVLVVVRAPHRGAAFEAARYAIDTVKHEVPIWKYEEYADGSHAYVKGCPLHEEHAHGAAVAAVVP
ncbi:MAG TPA: molybdenum cofactor biosynthesis protein MoaE [Rhodanobacteraceae bacterium]